MTLEQLNESLLGIIQEDDALPGHEEAVTAAVAGAEGEHRDFDLLSIHPQHTDVFVWQAWYGEGDELWEVTDPDAPLNHYADIDLARIRQFALHPLAAHLKRYCVILDENKTLLFTRRYTIPLKIGGEDGTELTEAGPRIAWHIVGWKDNKTNETVVTYIGESGESFTCSDYNYI